VHIVELCRAVVEVDTKVTNASITQNQCLQCVTPPLTHAAEIPRLRDANNDSMVKMGRHSLPNRTEFINFSKTMPRILWPFFPDTVYKLTDTFVLIKWFLLLVTEAWYYERDLSYPVEKT